MPSYNFEEYNRGYGGYYGASIKKNGIYVSKSLMEDIDLKAGDRVKIERDSDADVFRLVLADNGYSVSRTDGSGATVGANTLEDADFFQQIELSFGRYEILEDNGDNWIFKYNPDM